MLERPSSSVIRMNPESTAIPTCQPLWSSIIASLATTPLPCSKKPVKHMATVRVSSISSCALPGQAPTLMLRKTYGFLISSVYFSAATLTKATVTWWLWDDGSVLDMAHHTSSDRCGDRQPAPAAFFYPKGYFWCQSKRAPVSKTAHFQAMRKHSVAPWSGTRKTNRRIMLQK